MAKIATIQAVEILDSRGIPTLQVSVTTEDGIEGVACVPSGASTGEFEALELRDVDPKRYFGKGVLKAVAHVEQEIAALLRGCDVREQREIDGKMIAADGTDNKSRLGGNALLGVSLAVARAAAIAEKKPLYEYLAVDKHSHLLPCPMMNILNGGLHADNSLDFQEFMIRPKGARSFAQAMHMGVQVFYALKKILHSKGYTTAVGDEGGFAPDLSSNEQAIELILQAIEQAGYKVGEEVTLALDLAASGLYDPQLGKYVERKKQLAGKDFVQRTSEEQVDLLCSLVEKYPIDSIEDGMSETDWKGWQLLTSKLGSKIQLVGDDNFVTNKRFLERGIRERVANAILIKVNQIGTLTEALDCTAFAQKNHYRTVISHRSGETEDSFIADIAVATAAGQIKTGSLSRSDRIAKYNRLLTIEKKLGDSAIFYGG